MKKLLAYNSPEPDRRVRSLVAHFEEINKSVRSSIQATNSPKTISLPNRLLLEVVLSLSHDAEIFDVGAGSGMLTFSATHLLPNCRVDVIENNPDCLQFLEEVAKYTKHQPRINLLSIDIKTYDFSGKKYDCIVLSHILCFFNKPERDMIMERVKSSLKPNGIVYFQGFGAKDPYIPVGEEMSFDENDLTFTYQKEGKKLFWHRTNMQELRDLFPESQFNTDIMKMDQCHYDGSKGFTLVAIAKLL